MTNNLPIWVGYCCSSRGDYLILEVMTLVHVQGRGAVCRKLVWIGEKKKLVFLTQKPTATCYYLSSILPLGPGNREGLSRSVWAHSPCPLPGFLPFLQAPAERHHFESPGTLSLSYPFASSISTRVVVPEWHWPPVHHCEHRWIFLADWQTV